MAADPVIQELIDQLNELTAAAQQARTSTDNLPKTDQGQPQRKGDGSLGHPDNPISKQIVEQATINELLRKINADPAAAPFKDQIQNGKRPIKPGDPEVFFKQRAQRNIDEFFGRIPPGMSDEDVMRAAEDQSPNFHGFGRQSTLQKRRGTFYQKGYKVEPNTNFTDPQGPYSFTGGKNYVANSYTTARMNEEDLWSKLKGTAAVADSGGFARRDNPMRMYKQLLREQSITDLNADWKEDISKILDKPWAKSAMRFGEDMGIGVLARNWQGLAGAAGAIYNMSEDVRAAYFQEKAVMRMQPGLAKSIALMQSRQDNEDRLRNNIAHTAAAALFMSGVGAPAAAAIEGANYAFTLVRDLANKRYNETINRDAGIEDLIRHYGLGDTNKPATQRAKEFKDKFQTEGEFKAQLESSLDDLNKGYQRVGLGDFRNNVWQDGGTGFLRRAEEKMSGIAPMWYAPSKIFSMLDSSRLAVRQFASTNVPRAKNRTGD